MDCIICHWYLRLPDLATALLYNIVINIIIRGSERITHVLPQGEYRGLSPSLVQGEVRLEKGITDYWSPRQIECGEET